MGVEVIGAGYGRTGTTSFRQAMEILGFGKCYHMKDVIENSHSDKWIQMSDSKDPKVLRDIMDNRGYRSTCDQPACTYWKEQLQIYPNAKVVVTVRDPEKWYKSWMDTVALMQPDCESCPFGVRVFMGLGLFNFRNFARMYSKVITGDTFNGDLSKRNMIKSYQDHSENIKLQCPPEKVLFFNSSDGWEPLCKFLNVPIPNKPYPYLNESKETSDRVFVVNCIGWFLTILGCGVPAFFYMRGKITDPKKKSSNIA
jgi:Sulfotransferase domain